MDFVLSGKTFLLLLALGLLGYAFSLIGVAGAAIDSPWKLIALSLGTAIIAGFAFPTVRGVRKGDRLYATVWRNVRRGNLVQRMANQATVTALQNGRIGGKIRVKLPNNKHAEGVIKRYAGTFSLAEIKLTETER